jgi:hypothetical protein
MSLDVTTPCRRKLEQLALLLARASLRVTADDEALLPGLGGAAGVRDDKVELRWPVARSR